jgi:phosphoribosylamine--glycine ligase/phosphoribosylaminoimidazole synthetase
MKVLIVGSGGREHALAWKVMQSPRLGELYIAPGNAGTHLQSQNLPISADDSAALVAFARERPIDLVIVGPDAPLAAGLADDLRAANVRVFGPSRAAAEIEWSKVFAKAFMARHNFPTARYAAFSDFYRAVGHLLSIDYPVVIKASGLAAGKGVIVPDCADDAEAALRAIMLDKELGAAGDEVIIEERLSGEEVSLFGFTDGVTVKPTLPAQDHKRIFDGDHGPNTGGMGAYAPVPICPPGLVEKITRTILQPAVDGLRAEGRPFVGVLYAGLMLTCDGPRVLEFNSRFGDPETQVILPLLDSDFLDIAEACVNGRLAETDIRWKRSAAACVVLASEGYPGKYVSGREIRGLDSPIENAVIFHAGTRRDGDKVVTAGGRVLGVTGWGGDLKSALATAYRAVKQVTFEGMQYRRDIGRRAVGNAEEESSYASSGVSITSGNRAVELMREAVRSTYGPEVLAGIGAFGGLFDASALKAMRDPVLVASTDGVGTKVKLAAQAGRFESIGHDIVNHCVNDILVQGARPLFFLDYIAASQLEPEMAADIVTGIAAACREAGCALIGGETAEMPGVYQPGEFDVAGTIVGVVERAGILPRDDLRPGDLLLGLRSSGPHTNGYSLIRKVFEDVSLDTVFPELGLPLADVLLAPHRSYLPMLQPLVSNPPSPIKALAHLTGGGFIENIPRILPDGVGAVIRLSSWPISPLFRLIQQRGGISTHEMHRVFNMGIGLVAVVAPEQRRALQALIPEETFIIGELVAGEKKVILT